MDLHLNERSIDRQFEDRAAFRQAVGQVIRMREVARRFRLGVHLHRQALVVVEPVPGVGLRRAVSGWSREEQRSFLGWLTRDGPFWDDPLERYRDEFLECRGEVVTDSGIGAAVCRRIEGSEAALVSAAPSEWDDSPVIVIWRRTNEEGGEQRFEMENFREPGKLEERLRETPAELRSWSVLGEAARVRFSRLTFGANWLDGLSGVPFSASAARQIVSLLEVLDRLCGAFDAEGRRTAEGHRIHRDHFEGKRARFSDSSDTEKQALASRLSFPHPTKEGETIRCGWHGKVFRGQLRLHFSWPARAREPLYIVYVGPKRTRR